ncbi:MAG: HAD-IC family P-type ATPase [Chloroflexota bacterium]
MRATVTDAPQVIHSLPGRVRLRVGYLSLRAEEALEQQVLALKGVHGVRANRHTGNVLVLFDPQRTNERAVVAAATLTDPGERPTVEESVTPQAEARAPHALVERAGLPVPFGGTLPLGPVQRARITVRGLDRDPKMAQRVVERLQRHPGIRATANALTGRVLVEFRDHQTELDDVLATIADVELPDLGVEDRPAHPLDPAPLVQSAARLAAVGLGFLLLAGRRTVVGGEITALSSGAAGTAGIISIVQAFPLTRFGLRELLGRNVTDFAVGGINIVALSLSANPLGLALAGAEALRLVTEVSARRAAWRQHEQTEADRLPAHAGAMVRLDAGDRAPLNATVVEGVATALGSDGLPAPLVAGAQIMAGDRIYGGPLLVKLQSDTPFPLEERTTPPAPTMLDRYSTTLAPVSLAYAASIGVLTRSPLGALAGLALVNPRAALIGAEAATTGAAARMLRAGVVIAGTRPERGGRLPDVLIIDAPRVLTDGLEASGAVPLTDGYDADAALTLAAAVAAAAGSPWGGVFRASADIDVRDGTFDGSTATALLDGVRYTLGPAGEHDLPATQHQRVRGGILLALRRQDEDQPLALLALRPRLAPGALGLIRLCQRHGVKVIIASRGNRAAAMALARRVGLPLLLDGDLAMAVRAQQNRAAVVAVLSDSAQAAEAFAACDLAIGLSTGPTNRFAARADLLAPDLAAVGAIIATTARARSATRDAVAWSTAANVIGAVWGLAGRPGFERASLGVTGAALLAIADGWARLRGGARPRSAMARVVDPQPERWGRRPIDQVLATFGSSPDGLSTLEAAAREQAITLPQARHTLWQTLWVQLRTPITAILLVGAGVSAALGSPLDVLLIVATVGVGVAVGAWQEGRAGESAAALSRLSAATGRVLRDGTPVLLTVNHIVPGDVLLLAPGDHVTADARLLTSHSLEVDESALTGESLPAPKAPDGLTGGSRMVLEGSDVTVGSGRAIVIAVGRSTRLGATAAALDTDESEASPLAQRLSGLLGQILPVAGVGGLLVIASGFVRGQPMLPQVAIGASIAIAAVPEGLPLLSGVGQAAVAARLAGRQALVRRLGAVEALGRVDVACTDKTGTLTEGKPALTVVAGLARDVALGAGSPLPLPRALRDVLIAAALASPHPDHPTAAAHPTDIAVLAGAERAGLSGAVRQERTAEAPFDPIRAFHASIAGGKLHVKGATEALLPRCGRQRVGGHDRQLDVEGQARWRARAEALAARGLRVLMVAEGAADQSVDAPAALTALGFVGISDPLRRSVPGAVERCRAAGIRVIMVTGDHPATAAAIAHDAGILNAAPARMGHADAVMSAMLTGPELTDLDDDDLAARLANVAVIARVTPLDKLRIVESLQRRGHTVAMTGDGVNDAPALRLADVGVAMGRSGTEVARQAADVVLADDDFATLVEALVEGRSFWRNIRRALALLLGGNLGELGLVVGASLIGLPAPLVTRQILAVNLITDALPALAVAMQPPAHRHLADLAREGEQALDRPLRNEVVKWGALSAAPALAAFALALPAGLPGARAVALATIVTTQLVQTLDAGRSEGGLHRSVLTAVLASGGVLVAGLTLPPLRTLLAIGAPTPFGWVLIGGATLSTLLLNRALPEQSELPRPMPALPGRPALKMLPIAPSGP